MVSSISITELLQMGKNIHLIDIRSTEKYNDNHIPESINVPFEKLLVKPKEYLNFTDTFYLYCQKGTTSIKACLYLQKQGFKVVNISGGYESWIIQK